MRRFVVLSHFMVVFVSCVLAQEAHSLLDTVQLEEVIYYGEIQKYQTGAKIERISSEQINIAQEGGIENVLQRFTPIYIKSNAGGLSTIHFRGTSASHTSINFGGINLNSLTLGQSNLSSIPTFLFDRLSLQYGSSSAVNGSGAIGGAIYLGLSDNWTKGLKISTKATVGSFGEYLAGTKIFTGNGKWESVSRVYFYQKENGFPFNNSYTGDIENTYPTKDIQHGATINNKGFLQEFNYRFSKSNFLKSSVWIENNWYQIQPNMQSNYHYKGADEIENNNVRIWSEYTNNKHQIHYKGGVGYVHDMQIYNKIETQKIGTDRFIAEMQTSTDFISGLGLKAGAKYKYINPEVHAYSDSVIDFEQHLDVFFSTFYQINRSLKFSLNLRQMFITNFKAPFTPSLGAEYVIRTSNLSFVKLTSSASKSYRVPTFNDRYWGIQGNPDLKPESGKSVELGSNFTVENGECRTTIGVNSFYMNVDNWIEWRNFGVWKAENVLKVLSKGVEFQANSCLPVGKVLSEFGVNYTYNKVEPIKTIEQNGLTFRQMNYVPKHMANAYFNLKYKKWHIYADGQFTGERFTDDFGRILDANFIANCGVGYFLNLKKQQLELSFSSNNVLNSDYQNERYYAMPGRFFRFSVKYDITIIQ